MTAKSLFSSNKRTASARFPLNADTVNASTCVSLITQIYTTTIFSQY